MTVRIGIALCLIMSSCSKPIAVFHWSAKDGAMVKKGRQSFAGKKPFGYPAHKWYSRVVCFDDKCRSKAEWVKKQREHRFKGFKDGGKLPAPPPRKSQPDTTVMIASKPPKPPDAGQGTPTVTGDLKVIEPVASKPDSLIVLNEVLFAVNSYKLRPELLPKLDSIVAFLKKNPSTKIEISGHTDNTGSESHNIKLSENRANAVAEYIVDKGVETSRVTFDGFGSSRPVALNDDEQGRHKNRRVEILIHNRP